MNCPNCNKPMKLTDFSNNNIFYICNNPECQKEVLEKHNKPFVCICLDCINNERKRFTK